VSGDESDRISSGDEMISVEIISAVAIAGTGVFVFGRLLKAIEDYFEMLS
jgi:hypothetical protein